MRNSVSIGITDARMVVEEGILLLAVHSSSRCNLDRGTV